MGLRGLVSRGRYGFQLSLLLISYTPGRARAKTSWFGLGTTGQWRLLGCDTKSEYVYLANAFMFNIRECHESADKGRCYSILRPFVAAMTANVQLLE